MKYPQYFLLSIHVVELITVIVAILFWNKYKYSTEHNFIYFFLIVFLVDTLGTVIAYNTTYSNLFIYNSLFIFYFVFFINWYRKILERKKDLFFIILALGYFIFLMISFYKEGFTNSLQTINFFSASIAIIICSFFYYFQLLNSEKVLSLKTNLPFWITMGNIIYFVGMLPLVFLLKYLNITELSYSIIVTLLNWVTYTCYILGFKWMKSK